MGPNMDRLLVHYWDRQYIVPKEVRFLGKALGTEKEFIQGNPASPMIFNFVVDALV